jgi:hypothetical protein
MQTNLLYAGIGSRETPRSVLDLMTLIAVKLESLGYTLRSGGAIGADTAFEDGVKSLKEIFYDIDATSDAIELASQFHPAWHNCRSGARKLHGRNSMILLGNNLDTPVKFVVCWTRDGKDTGGTGLGIRIAESMNIPIFNLYKYEHKERIYKFLNINTDTIDIF